MPPVADAASVTAKAHDAGTPEGASLIPYFPPHLLLAARDRLLPNPPSLEHLDGTLLLADLSGFTHLTEQLQEQGRVGAEELTDIVNRALRPMVGCLEAHAGSILQFGGDAVFALFLGERHSERALEAASHLMQLLQEHGRMSSSLGPIELSMKVMLATGALVAYHVQASNQRVYLLSGPPCRRLDQLSHCVRRGEVLIDEGLSALAGESAIPDERGARLRLPFTHRLSLFPSPTLSTTPPPETLLSFLPPILRSHLTRGPIDGEFRPVALLFLKFQVEGMIQGEEEALERLTPFFQLITRTLEGLDGVLLKSGMTPLSDSLLIVVGIPTSHEDNALRASLIALSLRDRVRDGLSGVSIKAGVHAGLVVSANIGSAQRQAFDVMSDAVNLSARVMEMCPWGDVWLTQTVARQCESSLVLEGLGQHGVRGREAGVELFRLLERRDNSSQQKRRRLPPFVGRDAEMRPILQAIDALKQGQGSVLGIRAEAGVGKSRLWLEMRNLLSEQGLPFYFGISPSFGLSQPYAVFIDLLQRLLALDAHMTPGLALERVATLAQRGLSSLERSHIALLLGVKSGIERRRGIELKSGHFQAVRHLVQGLAKEGPCVLALEDLHWAEPSSLELIQALAQDVTNIPVLLVLLYRPTFVPSFQHLPQFREVALRPLSPDAGARLLDALLGGLPCPRAVQRRLVEQSAGIPFFLEELVRSVLEQGWLVQEGNRWVLAEGARVDSLPLPESIDAVLSARLHRLPPDVKRVAQRAAVIGRSFSYSLLQQICEEDIAGAIQVLRDREVVFELPSRSEQGRELIFKHVLLKEVAYVSLLERQRGQLHRRLAEVMLHLPASEGGPQVERAAWHLLHSEAPQRAVPPLLESARQALSQGRFLEARRTAEQALEVLDAHPESPEAQHRFPLLMALSDAVAWAGDYPRVLALYDQATPLAPGEAERADIFGRQAYILHAKGNLTKALEMGRRGVNVATAAGAVPAQVRCLRELARSLRERGELEESVQRFDDALRLSRERADRIGITLALRGLGASRCELGQLVEARRCFEEALQEGQTLADRRGELEAWLWLGRIEALEGRYAAANHLLSQSEGAARDAADQTALAECLSSQALLALREWKAEVAQERVNQGLSLDSRAILAAAWHRLLLSAAQTALSVSGYEDVLKYCELAQGWVYLAQHPRLYGWALHLEITALSALGRPEHLDAKAETLNALDLEKSAPLVWNELVQYPRLQGAVPGARSASRPQPQT